MSFAATVPLLEVERLNSIALNLLDACFMFAFPDAHHRYLVIRNIFENHSFLILKVVGIQNWIYFTINGKKAQRQNR